MVGLNLKKLRAIDGLIEQAIESRHIPGASALVYLNDQEQFYAEAGFADIKSGIPIRRDTVFRLFSMTKPVTGAAAMVLMQDGELDLNDPVSKYLSGFKNQFAASGAGRVPIKREMKIYDLLNMTSGLPYPSQDFEAGRQVAEVFDEASEGEMTTLELANRIGQCDLAFQPGERWLYGSSADVMGAVIEAVSGQPFGRFLSERIFAPLKMLDTGFYVPQEKQARLAKTYMETGSEMEECSSSGLGISLRMERPPRFESGGAGLASTIDDYMRFARMLLNGGELDGVRILAPKAVSYFTAGQLNGIQTQDLEDTWVGALAGFNYANFLRISERPERTPFIASAGEYGWDGAMGVYFLNSPKDKLSFILMLQRNMSGTLPLTRRIRNVIFSSL
ncbi:MAG: beta-lactamase family protein [Clostridiales bacterium]|jgi:CubicO group peptidase (beta-lactamase class C family)|nr:beta-lactamase family protein [Clostridiales bacterium]